ncbi:lipopolysaccharide biosynthesis protein [Anaerovibrio lipolyticus]|uniref:lipopolysaccharide biosynthesis protein n=1 Tax=Anaerovibrio lipolyticus TaxID=82374 RepID=UPI0004800E0A|nr:oligosaccharide flippase family protein [Anaerovibrio lipolyticus]
MKNWNGFYKNIAVMFSGNIVAHLLVVISTPVLARLFLPDEFGLYQLFLSFTSISSMVATGKYELAIIAPKYDFVAVSIAIATTVISLALSLILGVACNLCVDSVDFFKSMYFSGISFWIGSFTFVLCIYQICYMLFIRHACYKITVTANLIYSIGCVALPILAYYCSADNGLIKGMVIAKFIACLYFLYNIKKIGLKIYRHVNVNYYIRILVRYSDFFKFALPGNVLNTLSANAPAFLLNYFYGMNVTGYYSMANRCVGLPIALASKSVGDVFKQEAGKAYQLYGECYSIFSRVMIMLIKGSAVYSLVILLLAPYIFTIVLGEQWKIAGVYAQLLVLAGATGLIYSPLSSIFDLAVREYEYMILQLFSLILVVMALLCSGKFFRVEYTLFIYALAISIINIAGIIYCREISKGEKK